MKNFKKMAALCLLSVSSISFAETDFLSGNISNVTSSSEGLLVTLNSGVPENCSSTPNNWMLIKQNDSTMVSIALAMWASGRTGATLHTSGISQDSPYCVVTQLDADNSQGEDLFTNASPVGAIVAFDRAEGCPEGWANWDQGAGRVIVGSGQGSNLSSRSFAEVGGTETHTLSVDEIPAHSHSTVQMIGTNSVDGVDSTTTNSGEHHNEGRQTGATGGGQPHNIMQPYVVLNYCKKM
jgi:hypothetical protein